MDKQAMRGLLKDMENAAEKVLQEDSSFFEALQALKWEIDSDARVQSAVRGLRAAGRSVFSSFVPRIKIRVRTEEGIFSLAKQPAVPASSALDPVASLAQELKTAASAVIASSRCCRELERIVNEAVAESDNFENLAFQIESAGYEVMISLDVSAYAQIQPASVAPDRLLPAHRRTQTDETPTMKLSSYDLSFLKALKIKPDENLPI
jgi:hypothetical protein